MRDLLSKKSYISWDKTACLMPNSARRNSRGGTKKLRYTCTALIFLFSSTIINYIRLVCTVVVQFSFLEFFVLVMVFFTTLLKDEIIFLTF